MNNHSNKYNDNDSKNNHDSNSDTTVTVTANKDNHTVTADSKADEKDTTASKEDFSKTQSEEEKANHKLIHVWFVSPDCGFTGLSHICLIGPIAGTVDRLDAAARASIIFICEHRVEITTAMHIEPNAE